MDVSDSREGGKGRQFFAWLGLLVMAVSIVWWDSRKSQQAEVSQRPTGQPFSVVVLDAGHGGNDTGAMCGNVPEKELTLDIVQRLDRQLQARGLTTVMTRVGDSYLSLSERVGLTNRVPDCVFVSIHFNETNKIESNGVETYYADHQITPGIAMVSWLPFLQRASAQAPNPESQSLAGLIQESLVAHTQAVNRGTKAQQYYVIANVHHPAVLVEGGFLSNKLENARLVDDQSYREQLASAICDGILRYRDLKQRQAGTDTHGGAGGE